MQGISVSVQRKSFAEIGIHIIDNRSYHMKTGDQGARLAMEFYILLPGSRVTSENGEVVAAEDVPLGKREISLGRNNTLLIDDARNLSVNGKSVSPLIALGRNIFAIGTNSPQRIEGFHALVAKNK
jgi:hypothetical protein